MAIIKSIDLHNQLYDIGLNPAQSLKALSSALAQIGCTTDQMTQALRNISDLMGRMNWASDEITAIKDSLADMRYDAESADASLQCQIDVVNTKLNELRPDTNAKTENPNQKSDLEIFDWIIPSEEFLKLEGNMFIN